MQRRAAVQPERILNVNFLIRQNHTIDPQKTVVALGSMAAVLRLLPLACSNRPSHERQVTGLSNRIARSFAVSGSEYNWVAKTTQGYPAINRLFLGAARVEETSDRCVALYVCAGRMSGMDEKGEESKAVGPINSGMLQSLN